jgi:ribosomal protein S18 acetylase RimI-like enzyme
MSEPVLRRAIGADVPAIDRVVDAAYGHYAELIGRTPLPMLADHGRAVREDEVWVLDDVGTVVGVLELVPRDDHLWVENVAINPPHQGRGLGRHLLHHAEAEAQRHGLAEIRLLTNERYATNIAMYQRYGYAETHREPYEGTDLVHFRKVLQPAAAPPDADPPIRQPGPGPSVKARPA